MLRVSNILRLVLVVVVLTAFAVPVSGIASVNPTTAEVQSGYSDVVFEQTALELVCVPGDPGSSGSGNGGC